MIVKYRADFSALSFEGEVIGHPVYNPNKQMLFFLVKRRDGTFREVECELCREIEKYSEE